jgi:branched-chain amino acid transport system permease protein
MDIASKIKQRNYKVAFISIILAVILAHWKPYVLVEGTQISCLYAAIAIPMALILGIVGIINLAHGEFMMLGAFFAYWLNIYMGMDPFVALIPALGAFFLLGTLTYVATIKHILEDEELNQLLLTFGIGMIFSESANLFWTSQSRKIQLDYVSSSARIGSFSFGTFEFVYVIAAVAILAGLVLFLEYTRTGQAAKAVGQNPRGAKLVGINVNRTYLIVFSISIALVGAMGVIFATRHSIWPLVGGTYTMKSFCLTAMAGMGNISGILWASFILGISETLVKSFYGWGGWSDIIFFALIFIVILVKSYQRQVK